MLIIEHLWFYFLFVSMKKIFALLFLFAFLSLPLMSFAQSSSWGNYGSDPMSILDRVVKDSNADYKIQQTALDSATDQQWSYASDYKIANTLDRLRKNINPYVQRAIYIWLSVAVILLIYTGFLMVTNAIHKEGEFAKIKNRFIYMKTSAPTCFAFFCLFG